MSEVENQNELKGRFLLWALAILKTQHLLYIASRAWEAMDQENIQNQDKINADKFHEFTKTLPDYKESTLKLSHYSIFNSIYKKQFPELGECNSIHDACIELAIIYFCQILNSGNSDPGNASKNNKKFIDKHLTEISSQALSIDELENFNTLCSDLKSARDRMLGHADAKAFNIQHGHKVSSMKMHRQAWQNINIEFWRSILERLRIKILEYSNEVTAELQ